jgi:hypothetical protein
VIYVQIRKNQSSFDCNDELVALSQLSDPKRMHI